MKSPIRSGLFSGHRDRELDLKQTKLWLFSGRGVGMALALSLLSFPLFGRAAQVLHGHVPKVTARLSPVGELDAGKHLDLAISLPWRNQIFHRCLVEMLP